MQRRRLLLIGHLCHEVVWSFYSIRAPAALRLICQLKEGEARWNQQITSF
jgi:hypothetical protein